MSSSDCVGVTRTFRVLALVISLVLFPLATRAQPIPETGEQPSNGSGKDPSAVYIIRLAEPPLLKYLLDQKHSQSLDRPRRDRKRPDFRAPRAMSHLSEINKQHKAVKLAAERVLSRTLDIQHAYVYALNGFAVRLTPEEADVIAQMPGVAQMHPEIVRMPLTDAGPTWIGAPDIWDGHGTAGFGSCGEGIVIGILDTGIHPEHPSFAETGDEEYVHTNPKGRYFGVCDEAKESVYDPTFPCNNKLIGAWSFVDRKTDFDSPRDSDGHGTHVAATAVGNVLNTDRLIPTRFGVTLSGVAPRANVIVYDVCATDCPESATLAAIDQAVADGVDIINFSIGGSAMDPWADPTALALLVARDSGIFVSVAAGNSGPSAGTITSPANAPWVTAVGDATHNRRFTTQQLLLGGSDAPPPLQGAGITQSYGPASMVEAFNFGDGKCLAPFPAGTWENGEIVICERGDIPRVEKGVNVKAGGAGGMVLVNRSADVGLLADLHVLPAIHLSYSDGATLKDRLNAAESGNLLGAIQGAERILDSAFGDIVSSFSSRGPNSPVPDVLKPDLIAPGILILAAGLPLEIEIPTFDLLSGTSASAPHAAGAAALLMSLHPEWPPDMVRSALMTTAETTEGFNENEIPPADPFARGAGRINLTQAAQVGLILQESTENFLAADPTLGGDPKKLNLPSLADDNCEGLCSWQRTLESTLDSSSTWTASASGPSGMNLSVSPSTFTVLPGGSVTLTVEADVRDLPENQWSFGEVILSSQSVPEIRLTVAAFVRPPAPLPAAAAGSSGGGICMIGSINSEAKFHLWLLILAAATIFSLLLCCAFKAAGGDVRRA
jgi:subtilisin family serine protease